MPSCQRIFSNEPLRPRNVEIAGVRVALEPLLHLERKALHPPPHVGIAGRDPYSHSGRQRSPAPFDLALGRSPAPQSR
jgi:hypothetical protein